MRQLSAIRHQHSVNRLRRPRYKPTAESRSLRATAAFTLIELLTVITIIALLAALTIGAAKYAVRKAAENRTKAEMHALEAALDDYKADNGAYPANATGGAGSSTTLYNALAPASGKKYYRFKPENLRGTLIIDAFGQEFYYQCPGTHNTVSFDLWSFGANGRSTTGNAVEQADDITNWQAN